MKSGVRVRPQDYLWAGGIAIAIGLIAFGIVSQKGALTSAVIWVLVAYSALRILLRVRPRRDRHDQG